MLHARRLAARGRLLVLQVVPEELGQFIERDEVYPIVKIHVTSARNDEQFLGLAAVAAKSESPEKAAKAIQDSFAKTRMYYHGTIGWLRLSSGRDA
jgi:hypothetical protein